MSSLRIAYFGTPDFSAKTLEGLLSLPQLTIELVVTQPDRAIGRKQIMTPTPVKVLAESHTIEVFDQPLKAMNSGFIASKEIDLAILFAFGSIIPATMLVEPKYGFWNIHPSRLPEFRGASPMITPMIFGHTSSSITLMQMDSLMDHGDIINQESLDISGLQEEVERRAATQAVSMIDAASRQFLQDNYQIAKTPQNHDQATYTRLLKKDDGFIPLDLLKKGLSESIPADALPLSAWFLKRNPGFHVETVSVFDYFRALTPWPGIWTKVQTAQGEKRLKITGMTEQKITQVQLEGKNEVDFDTFERAYNAFN